VTARQSAIVVAVRLPPSLARLRRSIDPSAARGVPAHVTLLYPFIPAHALGPPDRAALAAVLAEVAGFEVRFAAARAWPGVVWLAPEPDAPFHDLIGHLAAHYPAHPPYGGAFDEVIPHLTIAERGDLDPSPVVADASRSLPFTVRVDHVTVIAEGDDGRWRTRWRFGLGVRP
jgi:2'-5' RNA ligase